MICADSLIRAQYLCRSVLPVLQRLERLECGFNPAISTAGWTALQSALLQLPALVQLDLEGCTGLTDDGARAVNDHNHAMLSRWRARELEQCIQSLILSYRSILSS